MSRFEQHESAGVAEQSENSASKVAYTLHLLDCGIGNGVYQSQSGLADGMNSNKQLLAQLADDSTPERSFSGLPMTKDGQPFRYHTYDEWDSIIKDLRESMRLEEV